MVEISHQALKILTPAQRDTIITLTDMRHRMRVVTAFELPEGYVAFTLTPEGSSMSLFGGIDPSGVAST